MEYVFFRYLKIYIAIFLIMVTFNNSYSEAKLELDPKISLPIDEKMTLFFTYYKDGLLLNNALNFANFSVREYGADIIPFLKKEIVDASFLTFTAEPKDVTLHLVGITLFWLHGYQDFPFNSFIDKPYIISTEDIQFFVSIYKQKIDEYIMTVKAIDDVVVEAETLISYAVGYYKNFKGEAWVGGFELSNYGHQDFFEESLILDLKSIQAYYQERLNIDSLPITAEYSKKSGVVAYAGAHEIELIDGTINQSAVDFIAS